jgi:hypothetical protein
MLKKLIIIKKPYLWASRKRLGGVIMPLSTHEYGFLIIKNQRVVLTRWWFSNVNILY